MVKTLHDKCEHFTENSLRAILAKRDAQLAIAVKALKGIVEMNGIMGCETVDEAAQALAEIEALGK